MDQIDEAMAALERLARSTRDESGGGSKAGRMEGQGPRCSFCHEAKMLSGN